MITGLSYRRKNNEPMNPLREAYEFIVEKNYQNLLTFSECLVVMEEMLAFLFPKVMLGEYDV